MRHIQLSSGDLLADRRAAYAEALARAGDFAAAAEVIAQTLELVPHWAAGWSLLGDFLKEAGDRDGAVEAYRRLAVLDADGVFAATLRLAALDAAPVPSALPAGYVEALFDDYAKRFETALVDTLGYDAPEQLVAMIAAEQDRRGVAQLDRGLDLGCGTGLMGKALCGRVAQLTGVDLSAEMLARARQKGLYARLERAEIGAFLAQDVGLYELITATDVFNYLGDLAPVLGAVQRRLVPGGLLAFTLERHSGTAPMVLQQSLRYAHSEAAALEAVSGAGLVVIATDRRAIRHDRGEPVDGLFVLASRIWAAENSAQGRPANQPKRRAMSRMSS